jgi:hypothetical protein
MWFSLTTALFVTVLGSVEDPCTTLCNRDGPTVCTRGSWTQGSICKNYLFRGDPSLNDYCYHTAATRDVCPSTGIPVKVSDVPRLLGGASTTTAEANGGLLERYEALLTGLPIDAEQTALEVEEGFEYYGSIKFLCGPANRLRAGLSQIRWSDEYGTDDISQISWSRYVEDELFAHYTGLFELRENAYHLVEPREKKDEYLPKSLGRFLAYSLYTGTAVDKNIHSCLFAKILNKPLILDDIREDSPTLFGQLERIRTATPEQLEAEYLVINGVGYVPTIGDREELIVRKLDSLLPAEKKGGYLEYVKKGFYDVIPRERLEALLSVQELKELIRSPADAF